MGLAVGEAVVDADDVALADDIERVAAGRVNRRRALLCGGSLGGALGGGGGGREEALSEARGNGRHRMPEGEVAQAVLLVGVASAAQTENAGRRLPPRRSGNTAERRRRTATPHRELPMRNQSEQLLIDRGGTG